MPHNCTAEKWVYKLHVANDGYYYGALMNSFLEKEYIPGYLVNSMLHVSLPEIQNFMISKFREGHFGLKEKEANVLDLCKLLDLVPPEVEILSGFTQSFADGSLKEHRVGKYTRKRRFSRLKKQRRKRHTEWKDK